MIARRKHAGRRLGLALVLALPLLAGTHASAAEASPPVAAFFDNPRVASARLSPDGRHLAMVVNNDQGRDQLGVVNLANGSVKVVTAFSDADVGNFEWVNNARLLYSARDKQTAQGDVRFVGGLYAVGIDGSVRRELAQVTLDPPRSVERPKLPVNTFMLGQPGAQDSNAVYVTTVRFGPGLSIDAVDLVRLDTVTGASDPVVGPGHVRRWWLDAKGRPALALAVDGGRDILYWHDAKTGDWRELRSRVHTAYADDGAALAPAAQGVVGDDANRIVVSGHRKGTLNFMPLGFAPDGTLYVISHQNRDTDALFVYDPVADKLADKPVVDLEAYDFSGELVANSARLLGIRYVADTANTAWFDPAMKAAQQTVDKLLPGRVNLLGVGARSETPYVLVESWSDRQPRDYLVLDTQTGKLTVIGRSRPAIAAARMGRQGLVQVKARDGQTIPTWVTMPPGAAGKNLPMVVLVHGGPQLRGHAWGWDADSQFLASRGYVVLAPEFRGSAGYGSAHVRAGWKQWGLAMQDDLADAARWAIAEGIADPKRICIAGGGYGGYAALMGLVRDPGLYQCGVDWAGVTDIDLLFKGHYTAESDMPGEWKQSGLPAMVGDPAVDAAQFAATSPLKQAARITQPLLLAYGEDDRRVPLYHGSRFHDAVRRTNPQVEWVSYKKEGYDGGLAYGKDDRPEWLFERPGGSHAVPAEGAITNIDDEINWVVYEKEGRGWGLVKTRVDFWSRVEKFLQRQIGAGAARLP